MSKIELKIAMKTWDMLIATCLIAYLHISNENWASLFKISRCMKYLETRTKHLLCGVRRVCLISYSSQTRRASPFFITFFGFPYDRQFMDKVLKKSIVRIVFRGIA